MATGNAVPAALSPAFAAHDAKLHRRPATTNTRIIVTHYGGPDALQVIEENIPDPKPNQVRVRVLAAGVALPDIMMREGIHPETPKLPFTPGWDFVGVVDQIGDGVSGMEVGQTVAALPIHGAYTEFICVQPRDLVVVPPDLDPAEAVSLVLNYVTAYQMMHRSAKVKPGQSILIHGAAGGVGTALLQLGRLAGVEMYGTCAERDTAAVSTMGAVPIDYQKVDFVKEIQRLTGDGVDVVFESIGGAHIWQSRAALRRGGKVVAYGITGSLREGRSTSAHPGKRHRFREIGIWAMYIGRSWLLSGRKRITMYSIQWLRRMRPEMFRKDLSALFGLLRQHKIKPVIAKRLPLVEAKQAHEQLGKGGITGKIVLTADRI